jgi:hypothetical protein
MQAKDELLGTTQKIEDGNIISIRRVVGLHHEYRRMAA